MEKPDKIQRLQDVLWTLNAIDKWAVNPSRYRKSHQANIHTALPTARALLKSLIEEAEQGPSQPEEKA